MYKKAVSSKIKAFIEKTNSEHNSALFSNKNLPNKTTSTNQKDYEDPERNNKKKEKKKKRKYKREYSNEAEESESDEEIEEELEE